MRTKIVVRLLDEEGMLLGWASLLAEARGDRCLRAAQACAIPIDAAGVATMLSYHWADLNIQKRVPLTHTQPMRVGDTMTLTFPDDVIFTFPSDEGPLPPVTVRGSVTVAVPTGAMGARPS